MFQQLDKYLDKVNLSITLSKKGDRISFAILPRSKDGSGMGLIPLVGSGTAEELDAEIANLIEQSFGVNDGLISNISEFTTAVKKKDEENKKPVATTTTAKTTPAKVEAKKEEVFDGSKLKGNDKKLFDKIDTLIAQAKAKGDIDMVTFIEKQAITEAGKGKALAASLNDYVNRNFDKIKKDLADKKTELPDTGLFGNAATIVEDKKEAAAISKEATGAKELKMKTVTEPTVETQKPVVVKAEEPVEQPGDLYGAAIEVDDAENNDDDDDVDEEDGISKDDAEEQVVELDKDDVDIF